MKRTRSTLILALFAAVVGPLAHAAEKAYTKPISDNLIQLEVRLPEGRVIKGMVQEGGLFRLEKLESGVIIGLSPVLTEDGVKVKVFQIQRHPTGDEGMRFLEFVDLPAGAAAHAQKAPEDVELRVLKTILVKPSEQ